MQALNRMAHQIDVNAQKFAEGAAAALRNRREAGQGTIEYVGIAVVITVIIAGLVIAFNDTLNEEIKEGISGVLEAIFGQTQGG